MNLKDIRGIGPKTLEGLNNNNINTLNDLLYAFPKAYNVYEVDNSRVLSGEYTTLIGVIINNPYYIKYRANVNACIFYVEIDNNKYKCVYFSSDYLKYKLFKGTRVMLMAKYKASSKELLVKKLFFENIMNHVDVDYKLAGVKNKTISRAIEAIFKEDIVIDETLPLPLLEKYRLPLIKDYLYYSHLPRSSNDIRQVIRRRKYEEFFWYALRLLLLKNDRFKNKKPKRSFDSSAIDEFINSLSYRLTIDQQAVLDEIREDILKDYPMNRLVQGDVGCGKSIVAFISALMEIQAGYQVAIMVPTEILAMQQYLDASSLFKELSIEVRLLTSSTGVKERREIIDGLANGSVDLIIGTHSLIMDEVSFIRLGLVIIDEQHRFGVNQRKTLVNKFPLVDAIYLSATPIPRSLGLTVFGDLDISSIKAMPEGRKPTKTVIIPFNKINGLYKSLQNHIAMGEQAYVVCPLVNENDELDRIDVLEAYNMLSSALPNLKIGVIHGKLKSSIKNEIMEQYKNKQLDILISTTVIEVGVNVKSATIMVILNAECFGLAQLHQLRGRVGRGIKEGFCALVSNDTLNPRLNALAKTNDGFIIAEEDFRLRGPGDYLGESQSGYAYLDYADFNTDINIWQCAKEDAGIYLKKFSEGEIKNQIYDAIILENINQKGKIN